MHPAFDMNKFSFTPQKTEEATMARPEQEIFNALRAVPGLSDLNDDEIRHIASICHVVKYKARETVLKEGEPGDTAYVVLNGVFCQMRFGHTLKQYHASEMFGEAALLDEHTHTATIVAWSDGALLQLKRAQLEDDAFVPADLRARIYKIFAHRMSQYLNQGEALYNEMDVLLIQDGGCAPGYNSVTAFLSEYLEKQGHRVFIAAAGFRSLVSNRNEDYRCLIYDSTVFRQLDTIRGVIFSPPLRDERGANFRSERFPDFKKSALQKQAAENILKRHVKIVVGIGGNGTFKGTRALAAYLPESVKVYFIPVTIDSDVYGTSCIGEFTGVEAGADKIHCYMADSRTHQRCYIIEMMGARGGFHALHSCLGAGAHLAVLPGSTYDLTKIAAAVNARRNTVIVVAEGYKRDIRKATGYPGNAAEFFRDELRTHGLDTKQKVVCEPFSRDIRGAAPNNMDITLAQRMARRLVEMINSGENRGMPAVQAGRETSIPFDRIRTDNSVECRLAELANRLY